MPPHVAEALWRLATEGPVVAAARRKLTLQKYASIKKSLGQKEKELHGRIHPKVESIVGDKSILLFKRMLDDTGYDDKEVATLLVIGVKLIGDMKALPFWQADPEKMAKIAPQVL